MRIRPLRAAIALAALGLGCDRDAASTPVPDDIKAISAPAAAPEPAPGRKVKPPVPATRPSMKKRG
jgi:hypothetical protein